MIYDAIIIGGGPAGLASALYLLRDGRKVLIIEKETIGGTAASTPLIENYPGFKAISGSDLTSAMFDQVDELGVDFEMEEVIDLKVDGDVKEVITEDNTYKTKTIIIASGSSYRTLGLPNEKELIGHGIHFCVACDGPFYKDKDIAIVGGGNSACINAYSMSNIAKHVTILQNLDHLTCEQDLANKLEKCNNVDIIYNSAVKEYLYEDDTLTGLIVQADGKEQTLKLDGVFLNIGLVPQNKFTNGKLDLDQRGYLVSEDGTTKVPGVFVAGDSRTKKYAQITIAVADGTIAALDAINYLNK